MTGRAGRRPRGALFAAGAIGVVVIGLIAVLATRSPALDRQATSPLLARPAPALSGTALDGHRVSLTDLRGRYVLVNFFASWCVPCQDEHPELQRWLARHAAPGDATVLGVIFDDQAGSVRDFLRRAGGDWPVVDDPAGAIALDYGVRGPPESYLINPDGIVLAKFIGGVTADGLDRLLARAKAASS